MKEIKYQQKYVRELVDVTIDLLRLSGHRKTLIFKAPTGSGKTVMASHEKSGDWYMFHKIKKPHPRPLSQERGVGRLKIYVFSPGRYPFTDNFREVEDKVELVALPAAIYDAYQKVLPKRKEKLFEEEKEQVETKIPADLFFAERSDLEVEREGQGV